MLRRQRLEEQQAMLRRLEGISLELPPDDEDRELEERIAEAELAAKIDRWEEQLERRGE